MAEEEQLNSDERQQDLKLASDKALEGLKVLVVDNQAESRKLVDKVLTRSIAVVKTSASAENALKLKESASFDPIVCDIGMPEMNGFQFIRNSRDRGRPTLYAGRRTYGQRHRPRPVRGTGGWISESSDKTGENLSPCAYRRRALWPFNE